MLLLSLFSGIAINGKWGFVFQFEFCDFLQMRKLSPFSYVLWVIVIISHVGSMVSLSFFVAHRNFKKMVLGFPLIYLVGFMLLEAGIFLLLIPFMVGDDVNR